VVLPPPLSESKVLRQALKAAGLATVGVATGRFRDDLSCVRVDDRAAAFDMTHLLLALGHKRIGFIKGHPGQTASAERLAGFRAALRICPGASAVVRQGSSTFASGLEPAEQILDAADCPTAIIASNDHMAAAAVSVAQRRGLAVPVDVSIVGFEDTGIATTLWPPLTTVRQPVSAMAAAAINLLIREMDARKNGDYSGPEDQVIAHSLIERQSSGPPRRM
jgi:LacI family transcriptional regulator